MNEEEKRYCIFCGSSNVTITPGFSMMGHTQFNVECNDCGSQVSAAVKGEGS